MRKKPIVIISMLLFVGIVLLLSKKIGPQKFTSTLSGCSNRHPEIIYTLLLPSNVITNKIIDDENRTIYEITGDGLFLTISCDTSGSGDVICLNNGIVDNYTTAQSNLSILGCYYSQSQTGQYRLDKIYQAGADQGSLLINFTHANRTTIQSILTSLDLPK